MAKEMVHHPDHYQGKGGLEVWQVQEAFTADLSGVIAGDACALIKYACRWPKKNGVEDLKKIIEYANHLIQKLGEEEETTFTHINIDLMDIRVPSTAAAEQVIRELKSVVEKYGRATVRDFYDLVGVTGEYTDNRYGWTDLSRLTAIALPTSGYRFNLPRVQRLDKEKESN